MAKLYTTSIKAERGVYRMHDFCGCDPRPGRARRAIDRFIADNNSAREFELAAGGSTRERPAQTPKWHAAALAPRPAIETGLERGKRLVVAGATDAADDPPTNLVEGHLARGRTASAASSRQPAEGTDFNTTCAVVMTPSEIQRRNEAHWRPGSPVRDRATTGRAIATAVTTDGATMIIRNRSLADAMRAHYATDAGGRT